MKLEKVSDQSTNKGVPLYGAGENVSSPHWILKSYGIGGGIRRTAAGPERIRYRRLYVKG